MPIEQTGAFWDETIYSPHDASHKPDSLIPLKGFGTEWVRDTARYGGYNKATQAYFFAFVATDKKGRAKNFFEGVPVHLVSVIAKTPEALLEYAEEIAREAGCGDAKILRAKVPLRQKFILDGDEFFLCGRSNKSNEIRAAKEMAASPALTKILFDATKGDLDLDDEGSLKAYRQVDALLSSCNGRLWKALDLMGSENDFLSLSQEKKSKILINVVKVACGASQGCDMKLLGRSASVGFILVNLASRLPDITWIDQSVTGVFERRTTYEDMLNGI